MSDSEFVTALHKLTNVISDIPRAWAEEVYPDLFHVLAPEEVQYLQSAAVEQSPAPETEVEDAE